ncbi:MAG: D-aminoacylase [bacterium]|nr:D-aminoacylase [bacterium]
MQLDTLLRQATLFDGTGAPPVLADVGIAADKIVAIGDLSTQQAPSEINAKGLWLTPGFIDTHTHSDAFLLLEPYAPSKLTQGVTTEIGGQCGGSAAPRLNGAKLPSDWEAQTYPPRPGRETSGPNWDTVADYRTCLEAAAPAINFILFTGHNTLRKGVMGDAPRVATPAELTAMVRNLEAALEEGAWGFTTGLVYHPGIHSTREEVLALGRACARAGGMYATHMRSEGDHLLEAMDEVFNLVRESGIHAEISHLKTSGKANWHKLPLALEKIEAMRAEGYWVHADRYPYLSAGTDLDIILPEWAAAGGATAILSHLTNASDRQRVIDELNATTADRAAEIMIGGTWSPEMTGASGKTLQELMHLWDLSFGEAVVRILLADQSRTGAFFFGMNEANLHTILSQPWVMPGSDASLRAPWGPLGKDWPHPRAYGTMPRFFRILTETLGLSPEAAIHRMTGLPAQAFGIPNRGVIREGAFADLVLLDPQQWQDRSTYANPHQFSTGVKDVFVNGSPVLAEGEINTAAPRRGRLLTRA